MYFFEKYSISSIVSVQPSGHTVTKVLRKADPLSAENASEGFSENRWIYIRGKRIHTHICNLLSDTNILHFIPNEKQRIVTFRQPYWKKISVKGEGKRLLSKKKEIRLSGGRASAANGKMKRKACLSTESTI